MSIDISIILETLFLSLAPIAGSIIATKGHIPFLKFEFIGSWLFALTLFTRPDYLFLQLLNSNEFTNYHWFLANLHGIYLVWSPLYAFVFMNSKDESVFYGHFWSRLVSHVLILIDNLYLYSLNNWNYRILPVSALFCIVEIFINLYFIFKTKQPKRPNTSDFETIDFIARLDAFIFIVSGIFIFAFPDLFMFDLDKSDQSYRGMCRTSGAFILSMSFESFCMVDFKYSQDKKTFMLSRLMGSTLELLVIFFGYFYLSAISTITFLVLEILIIIYMFIISYGFMLGESKVSKKSN